MSQLMEAVQEKWRSSSNNFALGIFRFISGVVLGLTFALVADEILDYGNLAFLFVLVSMTMAFMRLSRSWRVAGVLVFDLVCVLLAMLLRLYILIAPGQ